MNTLKIDIFCKIVDNYGDIGVCWRLAQQLTHDHGCSIRIIVDDLSVFSCLCPQIDPILEIQNTNNVTILKWNESTLQKYYSQTGDAVIEAFACTLPDMVVQKITETKPVWIDLEYLSAEDWIETHHAIPSAHPMSGVEKTLFFPGFTEKTGGLLRDTALIRNRDAFQNDAKTQNVWRMAHGLPLIDDAALDLMLFCYRDAPVRSLVRTLMRHSGPVRLFVTSGQAADAVSATGPLPESIKIHHLSFLNSDDFQHLLWTSDINFVRGEDSFVQAQWAGKPLIWHIYRQEKDAHMVKLAAFLRLYTRNLGQKHTEILENFSILWNERGRTAGDIPRDDDPDLLSALPGMTAHAKEWAAELAKQPDLAANLAGFIRGRQSANRT